MDEKKAMHRDKELKEHTDYTINCNLDKFNKLTASINCKLCSRPQKPKLMEINLCFFPTGLATYKKAMFGKEQHNLRNKDLDQLDRQKFKAALRITSDNVLSLLDGIPDSKGTKYLVYLHCMKSIL